MSKRPWGAHYCRPNLVGFSPCPSPRYRKCPSVYEISWLEIQHFWDIGAHSWFSSLNTPRLSRLWSTSFAALIVAWWSCRRLFRCMRLSPKYGLCRTHWLDTRWRGGEYTETRRRCYVPFPKDEQAKRSSSVRQPLLVNQTGWGQWFVTIHDLSWLDLRLWGWHTIFVRWSALAPWVIHQVETLSKM